MRRPGQSHMLERELIDGRLSGCPSDLLIWTRFYMRGTCHLKTRARED